ncbi:MAG: SDR family oxidoreductase [Firmicutes bacterium]|nr:SDR family oxidoreductase [Bacillota bacterium]
MENSLSVVDKRILITGATRGIGAFLAHGLAQAGARVGLCGRTERDLQEVAAAIYDATGQTVATAQMDVRDVASIQRAVDVVRESLGGLDGLVNNAGVNIRTKALDVTEQDWDTVVDTDLKGTFFVAQAVGQTLCKQGHGAVVNISSVGGHVALRTGTAYASAKAGVIHMTKSLACEWAKEGVRVNCVAPWYFKTPLTEPLLANEEYHREVVSRTPMGRVGELHELLGPIIFFLSDAASYVTGQTLLVDGGMGVYGF